MEFQEHVLSSIVKEAKKTELLLSVVKDEVKKEIIEMVETRLKDSSESYSRFFKKNLEETVDQEIDILYATEFKFERDLFFMESLPTPAGKKFFYTARMSNEIYFLKAKLVIGKKMADICQ
jgi:hypothetical protein